MKHDIAELDLSVRAYNCLKQAGIHYVEDVSEMSDADLLAVRHLGIRCLHEVREKVAACEHGMSERDQLKAENARLKQELEAVGTAAYLYGRTDLADENAKLREQTELLVTLLRNDCDIEASWDGLRHFWSIELTDDGCLMRDRACKAEAENAKLRELCADMYGFIKRMDEDCGDVTFSDCFDYCKHDTADDGCCKTGECWYEQRLHELGIGVDG